MTVSRKKLYESISNIVISASVLFAALAWRDAGVAFVENHPEFRKRGPWVYAIIVTCIAIVSILIVLFPLKSLAKGFGQLYESISNIVISAFVLFAALAWRDAGIAYVDVHPEFKNRGPWIYASFVTIIVIAAVLVVLLPLKKLSV